MKVDNLPNQTTKFYNGYSNLFNKTKDQHGINMVELLTPREGPVLTLGAPYEETW